MTRFYEVLRTDYDRAGKQPAGNGEGMIDVWAARLTPAGLIPARSATDALVIAKALGHFCPIVQPKRLEEKAK